MVPELDIVSAGQTPALQDSGESHTPVAGRHVVPFGRG